MHLYPVSGGTSILYIHTDCELIVSLIFLPTVWAFILFFPSFASTIKTIWTSSDTHEKKSDFRMNQSDDRVTSRGKIFLKKSIIYFFVGSPADCLYFLISTSFGYWLIERWHGQESCEYACIMAPVSQEPIRSPSFCFSLIRSLGLLSFFLIKKMKHLPNESVSVAIPSLCFVSLLSHSVPNSPAQTHRVSIRLSERHDSDYYFLCRRLLRCHFHLIHRNRTSHSLFTLFCFFPPLPLLMILLLCIPWEGCRLWKRWHGRDNNNRQKDYADRHDREQKRSGGCRSTSSPILADPG